jgi:signal transduction histidine kinase
MKTHRGEEVARQVFDLLFRGGALDDVLRSLVVLFEEQSAEEVKASILVLDAGELRRGASPSLPQAFVATIDRTPLDSGLTTFSEAARLARPVEVPSIDRLETQEQFKALSLAHGLRACWSYPIVSGNAEVLGSFTLYFQSSRPAVPSETAELAGVITKAAALAIERSRADLERQRLLDMIHERGSGPHEFLAIIGHELRGPLAPLLMNLEVLREFPDRRDAVEHARAVIERQVRRLSRLIDDLADVSQLSLGKLGIQAEPCDLTAVVRSAVEATSAFIESRRHTFRAVGLPPRLPITGDPVRLEQVLINLLNNAAKYTEPGGRIELELDADGAAVVIKVRDSGVGFDAETASRMFRPFVQGKALTDSGLGVGLALARQFTELHGGTLEATSAGPGKGSEFIVRLPKTGPAAADTPAERAARESGIGPAHPPVRTRRSGHEHARPGVMTPLGSNDFLPAARRSQAGP